MTDYDPTLDPGKNQIRDYDGGQRQQDARYANIPPRPAMPTGELGDAPEGSLVPPALLRALHEYALLIEYAWMLDALEKQHAAEYLSVVRRQADLNNLNKQKQQPVQAWCADYTEELTGEVATLEVPGEVDPTIGGGLNIKPGDADAAAWSAAYGQIQLGTVLTPAAFAWNFAMLVPWMKWKPLWRYATVNAVDQDNDTVNVTLHPILSKTYSWLRRDLTINDPWESSMNGVAVEYMDCNAEAFEVGDEVIVEFREEGGGGLSFYEPYVIGFKQEPRECPGYWPPLACVIGTGSDGAETWGSYIQTSLPTYDSCWESLKECGASDNVFIPTGPTCRTAGLLGPSTGGGEYQQRKTIHYKFNKITDYTVSADEGILFDHTETYANSNYSKYQQSLTAVTISIQSSQLWVEIHDWSRPEFGGGTMVCTGYCPDGVYMHGLCGSGGEATAIICARPVQSGSDLLIYSGNKIDIVNWYVSQGLPLTVVVTDDEGREKTYETDYDNSNAIYVYYKPREE